MIRPVKAGRNLGWAILTLTFWIIALRFISPEFLDLGGDSAQYIILGESLSSGKGLRMINYPGEPASFYYPPVFPLLLYPLVHFFGRNFYLMHLLVAFLGYLSLFFFYRLFKKYADWKTAFLIVTFFALNWVFILSCANNILSDVPYLFFSGFTLLWIYRYAQKPSFFNKEGLLGILGLSLSYLTRYAGLTLFLGLLTSILLTDKEGKSKKAFFLGSAFLFVFLIWNILKYLNPTHLASHASQFFLLDPYAPQKGTLLTQPLYLILRFTEGVNYYYKLLFDVFFLSAAKIQGFLRELFCGLIMGLTLLGLWVKFREKKESIFHYYFLFYLLLIVFWPFREGIRFLLPILPFIFFYFFTALKKILSFKPRKISACCFFVLASLLLILNIWSLPKKKYSYQEFPQPLKNFISLHTWIKENLPPEGVVVSRKPTITYFYTAHKSIVYPYTPLPDKIWSEALNEKARYIIADEFSVQTYQYLLPFLYKYKDNLKMIHRIENTAIFEVSLNLRQ